MREGRKGVEEGGKRKEKDEECGGVEGWEGELGEGREVPL